MKQALSLEGSWKQRSAGGKQEFAQAIDIDTDFSLECVYLELGSLTPGAVFLLNGVEVGSADDLRLNRFRVSDSIRIGRNELVVRCEGTSSAPRGEAKLISYDTVSVSGIRIEPEVVDNIANVWISIDVANHTCEDQRVTASIVVAQAEGREKVEMAEVISPFGGEIEAVIRIVDPSLWQLTESGKQQFFDCLIGLQASGEVMDVAAVRFDIA